jgi:hypothetical protein
LSICGASPQDHWFDPRSADFSRLNDWTHRVDANSLQLDNRSMAFISSPEFQSRYGSLQAAQDIARTAESSSMFAGLSASTAPNLLDEHAFPQAGDPPLVRPGPDKFKREAQSAKACPVSLIRFRTILRPLASRMTPGFI